MGKKNSEETNGLAVAERPGALAVAQRPAARLEGGDADDLVLPRIHIYQGLPKEAQQYGKGFEPGDLINVLTNEKVTAKNFLVVSGHKQWIKWKEPRGAGLEYSHRNKADVPPGDLAWNGDQPPLAQEYINWLCIFEGQDTPCILPFMKTSLAAGKTINTMEMIRSRGNKGPGLYALEMVQKSNDQGAWMSPRIRPAGDPPEEMADLAAMWMDSLTPEATAKAVDASTESFNPDSM